MRQINTNRPLVGIVSSRDGGKMMMNQTYMNAIWRAGGLPVVLNYTTDPDSLAEYAAIYDGFLFSGGVDVDPVKYGEEKQFDSVEIDDVRDAFEEALFKAIYPTGKPILGICRGIQSINVWMGGTLHQHIEGHRQEAPGTERTHSVRITEGSLLSGLCGKTEVMVNTFHHEAVKVLAPALSVDAVSADGYVEAAHQEGHRFLFATQFHPEIYCGLENDDHSLAIFTAFVEACR
jgi:putative glutamine amidotransferase